MDAWMAVLAVVAREAPFPVYTYRWRPAMSHTGGPELPGIWNWLNPSPHQRMDTARVRDSFALQCRCGMYYSEDGTMSDQLEQLVDTFRTVVDPLLWNTDGDNVVLAGTVYKAQRGTTQTLLDRFTEGQPVLAVAFDLQFDQDRNIR